MATIHLPHDFKEFLKLLNENKVEYLLVGGYAVSFYGYPRATADMDIWVAVSSDNSERLVSVLKEFGFGLPELSPEMFQEENNIIRMGNPPVRIEIIMSVSGVDFQETYKHRVIAEIDGIEVNLIDLEHLKINKKASGRFKDLDDLEHLP